MTKNTADKNYGDTEFLTGIRAIAILFVFLIHSGGGGLRELSRWGDFLVDCGKFGVQIFFVISGFTIFSQLFREHHTFKKFILIRITRLSLPYFPILIALFIYANIGNIQLNNWATAVNDGKIDAVNLLAHLTYVSSYDIRWQNTIIGIEWTLGVEVFFYVAIGLLIHFCLVKPRPISMITFGMMSVAILGLQLIAAKMLSLDPKFVHWLPFGYFPIFYMGALAFVVRLRLKEIYPDGSIAARALDISTMTLLAIIFFSMLIASTFMKINNRIPEAFFVMATFLTIITHREGVSRTLLRSRPLHFIGSISFSFYLLHYLVILFAPRLINSAPANFFIQLTATIAISIVWSNFFEKMLYQRAKSYIKRKT